MRAFARQLNALIYKNVLVAIVRRPIGFLLSIYAFPLAILALLLSIPSLVPIINTYGTSDPAPIRPLGDTVDRKLVIVRPLDLGGDVDRVIDTFTQPIRKDLLVLQNDESSLLSLCLPNTRGISECHAIVIFKDSPRTTVRVGNTTGDKHTWSYTIRADPARDNSRFDVKKHKSDQEDLYLPLQLAINNAITSSATTPETVMFTTEDQDALEQLDTNVKYVAIGGVYVFALISVYVTIIYRLTTFITSERDAGMSQLVDSMGGGSAIATRVLSWIITFDLSALPCYIGLGVLYHRLAFSSSSVTTLIGWQVLLGFAINSSTAFAAAFFSKSRISAIYVTAIFIFLSIFAQLYASEAKPSPRMPTVAALSSLFPSSNNVFFTQQMCLWQISGQAADFNQIPPEDAGLFSKSYDLSQKTMLVFLVFNILAYPIAAMFIEKLFHGIHHRKRTFFTKAPNSSGVVAQTLDLRKIFVPAFFTRICCCGRRKPVIAVDGVSFQARQGQIMCLVGPNGSGKTTTLHTMSGCLSPTTGSIIFDAPPTQIGICPQRNTLWDDLTVEEHIFLWDRIKAGHRPRLELEELVQQCDLYPKRGFKAKELSGGQKRKLQLACMLVGSSTVCLIDECTSGLDPLSRRAIWEILLKQRSKRSIILTTHFLDEVDVLADQIILVNKGRVKCQGSPAELKNLYGGGYKVLAPLSAANIVKSYPHTVRQDKLIYHVPDSRTAAQMVSTFVAVGVTDVAVTGPQFEDVFLNLLNDDNLLEQTKSAATVDSNFVMTPSRVTSFWTQFLVLYGKRWTVLKRFWGIYFFAVVVPLAVTYGLGDLLRKYQRPACDSLQDTFAPDPPALRWNTSGTESSACHQLSVAPRTANASVFDMVKNGYQEMAKADPNAYGSFVVVHNSRDELLKHIAQNRTKAGYGGVFAGSPAEAPVLAYMLRYGDQSASLLLDLWSQMQGSVEITSSQELIAQARKSADSNGMTYLFFFALLQVFYPTVFVLYPGIEKSRKVRALQYANGVRRAPLWAAYWAFDCFWVVVASIGVMALITMHKAFEGPPLLLLLILVLYGVAATLMGYCAAHFTNGPLKSYLAALGVGILSYTLIAVSLVVSNGAASQDQVEKNMAAIAFGANLFFPIGNVFRALLVGFNLMEAGCQGGKRMPVTSINGLGGPILYLLIQVLALLLLTIWLEGGMPRLRLGKAKASTQRQTDMELSDMSLDGGQAGYGVAGEARRAEKSGSDLLQALHISKTFSTKRAVDDLTFGLPKGDVLALLGPNGAGKSTLVNMIQAELTPDQGQILLCQEDCRSLSSQKNLGVCPQYDAPDLMSTRNQLMFYARIKGIKETKANVDYLMARLGLTPHARTQASKLSGGNKRKLMLAIALIGTPPVVVLDEPTSAMDAVAKRSFWKIIQAMSAERSVLLTTHSMEEADALATRTVIMARRFLAIGTTPALRERYSTMYYVNLVLASAPTSAPDEMARVGAWVQDRLPGTRFDREMLGGQVRFTMPAAPDTIVRLIQTLERDKEVLGIGFYSISGPTLENVFLSVVRENQVQEEDGAEKRRLWKALLGRR